MNARAIIVGTTPAEKDFSGGGDWRDKPSFLIRKISRKYFKQI
jgi:hypothetical protein